MIRQANHISCLPLEGCSFNAMVPTPFVHYELRTFDLERAATFYSKLFDWELREVAGSRWFFRGDQAQAELAALPARARILGAPAHWLGHLGVPSIENAVNQWLEHGAQLRGEIRRESGGDRAVLRDPHGAMIGLHSGAASVDAAAVVWHELNTTDLAGAWSTYAKLCGWEDLGVSDFGPPLGAYQRFCSWGYGSADGGMVASARLPGVHTHWLYYFAVTDLKLAIDGVWREGGEVFKGPLRSENGDEFAVCHDTEGAAFGLRMREKRPL